MKVIIIGAGCVGLSIAYKLLKKFSGNQILVIDRYNIPSKGELLKKNSEFYMLDFITPQIQKIKTLH